MATRFITGTPGCDFAFSGTDCGYHVQTVRGSTVYDEMAYMYFTSLGLKPDFSPAGVHQGDFGIFGNGTYNCTDTSSNGQNDGYVYSVRLALALNEFDLIAVGVAYERNHRGAAFDRSRFPRNVAALRLDVRAGFGDVLDRDRDMAVGGADIVFVDSVVVGQFQFRVLRICAIADEGERIFLVGTVGIAQELHAKHLGIKIDRALEIADAQHRVMRCA